MKESCSKLLDADKQRMTVIYKFKCLQWYVGGSFEHTALKTAGMSGVVCCYSNGNELAKKAGRIGLPFLHCHLMQTWHNDETKTAEKLRELCRFINLHRGAVLFHDDCSRGSACLAVAALVMILHQKTAGFAVEFIDNKRVQQVC